MNYMKTLYFDYVDGTNCPHLKTIINTIAHGASIHESFFEVIYLEDEYNTYAIKIWKDDILMGEYDTTKNKGISYFGWKPFELSQDERARLRWNIQKAFNNGNNKK